MAREMKDSGVEWIGEIPKYWKIRKLKSVSEINSGEYISKEDYESQGAYDIIGSNGKIGETNKTNINKKVITTGRVGSIGTAHIVQDVWVTDNALIINTKENIFLEYLAYIIPMFPYEIISAGTAQPLITATILKNQYIPYSDLDDQKKITDFLNEKVKVIDSVILKTKETIEGYNRLKQAVITQAVTKGIRNSRKTSDSGSAWFGQIPSDWCMKKIKYIFKIQKDIAREEGHTVLSITQKGIKPKDLSKNEGQLAENYSNYQLVHIGDFA
ncbi:MAG: restriction endonuclease subunit S, partial [Candidatus Gastranaerophilales bacterium]|nr:restriction endonuclease subunit S [Candidatus Gastranaerophilales bacterium]